MNASGIKKRTDQTGKYLMTKQHEKIKWNQNPCYIPYYHLCQQPCVFLVSSGHIIKEKQKQKA